MKAAHIGGNDEGEPMGEHGPGVGGATRDIGRDFKTRDQFRTEQSIRSQKKATRANHLLSLPDSTWPQNQSEYTGGEAGAVDYKIPPRKPDKPGDIYEDYSPAAAPVSATTTVPERQPAAMNVRDAIARQAEGSGIPPRVAVAAAFVASGLDQTARGKKGEVGAFALPDGSGGVIHDIASWRDNVNVGVRHLAMLKQQEGTVAGAIQAHLGKAGLARVKKALVKFPTVEDFPKGDRGVMTVHAPLPVAPTYLSDFGIRKAGEGQGDFHSGIDIAAPMGTPVLAVTGGKVMAASRSGAAGNFVTVRDQSGRQWSYAHLQDYLVKPGAVVKPGDRIGSLGMTGSATNPHLHFSVRVKGQWGNPLSVAQRAFALPAGKTARINVSADDFAAPAEGGPTVGAQNAKPTSPITGQPSRAQAWQNIVDAGPVGPETATLARRAGAVVPE